jgi:hypothetical protein
MKRLSITRFAFALALILPLLLASSSASAQKAGPVKAKTVNGVRVTKWKARNTRFEHRTHGNSKIGWERRATGKDGVTKISGKLWGNKIKGESASMGGKTLSILTATSKSGQTRNTVTLEKPNGTVHKTIKMSPEGITRKITSWFMGGTKMTSTRDYDSSGKLIKRTRTGHKR